MLSCEHKKALAQAKAFYEKGRDLSAPLRHERLNALQQAFDILWQYLDEINARCVDDLDDSIYFKVVLANIIQTMQDTQAFDLSFEIRDAKASLYNAVAHFSMHFADEIPGNMRPYFWSVLYRFALQIISLEPNKQRGPFRDHMAKVLFDILKFLDWPHADLFISRFKKDERRGWIFTGERPEKM